MNDKRDIALSIVVPAYNEADRLAPTLDRMVDYLEPWHRDRGVEVIVVDDGSSDETAAIAARYSLEHPFIRCLSYRPNRGKGYAVRTGMLAAVGDRRLFSDADLSTPIEELERLWEMLDQGYDIAFGSRAMQDSVLVKRQPAYREMMGRTFNVMVRMIGLSRYKDTQCGFKMFTARSAQDLFSRASIDRFAFDVEILLLAEGHYKLAEIPVHWAHAEESRVSPGWDSAQMMLEIIRVRARCGLERLTRSRR